MASHRLSGDEQTFIRHYPSTSHLDKYRTAPNPKINNNKSTVLLNASSSNLNLMPPSYMPKTTMSTFASHKSSNADLRYRDDPNPYKVSDIGEYRIKVQDPFVPKSLHRSQQVLTFYSDDNDYPYAVGNGSEGDAENFGRQVMFDKFETTSTGTGTGNSDFYPSRVQRSQTLKSTSESHKSGRSHHTGRSSRVSGSVSISSAGDGDIEVECEIPEPDYEGSTAGSSEDIPLPIPDSSCSEEYSSVSAGSDPDHYNLAEGLGQSPSPDIQQQQQQQDHRAEGGADSGLDTPTKITSEERVKIEYALKGRKTTVFVADSLANLYVMKKSVVGSRSQRTGTSDDWVLKYTGVPVLLLDSGETKSRDKRQIKIVLAELGSGLALWKDVIDNLTSYKVMEGSNTFHSFHFSLDHSKVIGLSFDDEESAVSFSEKVDKLTSDFANISLSGSKGLLIHQPHRQCFHQP
ncbi:uncharacterized protein LOC110850741 isoform X2 [Folsomia candida]|uniref:uncharacterized protein LOC110850741 isoform X2 n=1 Tax=Folsomia candida TaxID=158441 RepID=UPI0016053284|nr:uncharacterized protein LOC110850741 isoform X2 [Folsomia candida]